MERTRHTRSIAALATAAIAALLLTGLPAIAASAEESVLRVATVYETVGEDRVGATIRMPLVLSADEVVDPATIFVTRAGSSMQLVSQVANAQYDGARLSAADVYVIDDVTANKHARYEIHSGGQPRVSPVMAVEDSADSVSVTGDDLQVVFDKIGAAPGTISGITSPGIGVSSGNLSPTATIRQETLLNAAMNADVEESQDNAPRGWTGSGAVGDEQLTWSDSHYASGLRSLEIDTTASEQPESDALHPAAIVLDFADAGYFETGAWRDSSKPGYQQPKHRWSEVTDATATWETSLESGDYDVYLWIPTSGSSDPYNPASAAYTISHATGDESVSFDQRVGTNQFTQLGTWGFDGASEITLTVSGTGTHRADAVLFIPAGLSLTPPAPLTVDTTGDAYSETGTWGSSTYPGYTAPSHRHSASAGATATWTFPTIHPGEYDLYAWVPKSGNSDPLNTADAVYSIRHSDGSATASLDQRVQTDEFRLLGTWALDADSAVDLTVEGTGRYRADTILAVAPGVAPIPPADTEGIWTSDPVTVAPGERLFIRSWGKTAERDTSSAVATTARFTNAAGDVSTQAIGSFTADAWAEVSRTVTVPAGATGVHIEYSITGKARAWFDNLTVYRSGASTAPMDGTSATQRNVSIDVESGPVVTSVRIVNQQLIAGVAQQAFQLIEYRIPKHGTSIQQTVEYRGTAQVEEAPHSLEATSKRLLAGSLDLGGSGADQLRSFSTAFSYAVGDLNSASAIVDDDEGVALVISSSSMDMVSKVALTPGEVAVVGPTRVDGGPSNFAYRLFKHDRTWANYALLDSTGTAELQARYLTDLNPLVASVDDPSATFDNTLEPLIKELNDLVLTSPNPKLSTSAWTSRALAAYVNWEITGDESYRSTADALINANITAAELTAAYHASRFAAGAPLLDEELQQMPYLFRYNPDPRLPRYAEAVGLGAIEVLGFDDDYGDPQLAGSVGGFSSLESRSSVKNMALLGGTVFAWGMYQRGNAEGLAFLERVFEGPAYTQWDGAALTSYNAVLGGKYTTLPGEGVPYYSGVIAGLAPQVEYVTDGEITMTDGGQYGLYPTITVDSNALGGDASGWPQWDYIQTHSHRYAWTPMPLWLSLAALEDTDGTEGVTTAARLLEGYVSLTRETVSDDTGATMLPNISDPDFGRVFNLNWYATDGLTREINPGVASSVAKVANMMYYNYHHVNGPDEEAPVLTVTVAPDAPSGGWYTGEATLSASAVDNDDLAPKIEYRIGTGDWTHYTAPVTIDEDGLALLSFRAADGAGNESAEQGFLVRVDTTAPSVDATIDAIARTVTLQASDATSGAALVQYRIGPDDWLTYAEPIVVGDAATTVEYRAYDLAGNVSGTADAEVAAAGSGTFTGNEILSLGQTTVAPGGRVTVEITGGADGTTFQLELHSDPAPLGTLTIDASEGGSAIVTIPTATSPGAHEIHAIFETDSVSAAITVTAGTGSDLDLADTGAPANFVSLGLGAALLLLLGAAIVLTVSIRSRGFAARA